jgi:superfamily I DNA and/or RNA helicase
LLSTIGSSGRLPAGGAKSADTSNSISDAFGRMTVSGTQKKTTTKTIVVFDEAGCIPSYELLGLSMLGHSISSLVCVGDKNQLPPYDPSSMVGGGVQSLLDVSQLTADNGKIKLTTQYRVPHDIANLLNHRIYEGDYQTAPESSAPLKGFHFVHIPGPVAEQNSKKKGRKKYDRKTEVNKDEIKRCLEIVLQSKKEGIESIMVLTPVSLPRTTVLTALQH